MFNNDKKSIQEFLINACKANMSKIEVLDFDEDDFNGGTMEEYFQSSRIIQPKGYKIKVEDSYGGEGDGDKYWAVYSISNTDTKDVQYLKFYGYYDSWNGTTWEDFSIVEPKEETIIVYVDVK